MVLFSLMLFSLMPAAHTNGGDGQQRLAKRIGSLTGRAGKASIAVKLKFFRCPGLAPGPDARPSSRTAAVTGPIPAE